MAQGKVKERITHVRFPVFSNYTVEVIVSDNPAESRANRSEKYGVYEKPFHALHTSTGCGDSCMFFPKDADIGAVAHECYHAVSAIASWANVDDPEFMAYHLGYLVKAVHKFVCSRSNR